MKLIYLGMTVLLIVNCQSREEGSSGNAAFSSQLIPVPSEEGGAPNLFITEENTAWLSWVEYVDDTTDVLLISQLSQDQWSSAQEVSRGSDWFVNWADFPSVAVFHNQPGSMAAHWLQKSADGTYDYDVRIALSMDSGESWAEPFIPHTDGVAAEHGFVTMMPLSNGRIFATWLDGRNTKDSEDHRDDHGHGQGAMTLRTAEFDMRGNLYEETELDKKICDCCQTDATITSAGPVVVYRDRSDDEVRDISIVRKIEGQWTEPQSIHNDNWEIAGCPVNGPAVAANQNNVVVVWYTVVKEKGRVNVAFSSDAGKTFATPVQIDDGRPLGRVDVVYMDEGAALVSWLEKVGDSGEIRLAKVTAQGKLGQSITATQTDDSRQSGFPILAKMGDKFLLTWTTVNATTSIKSMEFSL